MKRLLLPWLVLGLQVACALPRRTPRVVLYEPQLGLYTFTLDRKYQVTHAFLRPSRRGEPRVKGCLYAYATGTPEWTGDGSYPAGAMYQEDGHVYQMALAGSGPIPKRIDRQVLGYEVVSSLGGGKDAQGNTLPAVVNRLHASDPIAHERFGGIAFDLYLQKSSAHSMAEDIRQRRRLLETAWASSSTCHEPETLLRGANRWTCARFTNRAIYLSDQSEYWYLACPDGSYYYRAGFHYQSALRLAGSESYILARAAFEQILDSFRFEPLVGQDVRLRGSSPLSTHPVGLPPGDAPLPTGDSGGSGS